MSTFTHLGELGGWNFYRAEHHGFEAEFEDRPLFGFTVGIDTDARGLPRVGELYPTLDHAMAAAIAEKYTGKRGAGGTGVDTAAGWFMRMIGADDLTEDPEGVMALGKALKQVKGVSVVPVVLADQTVRELRRTGHVLARPARD